MRRAWFAQYDEDPECCAIVFAETRGKARVAACKELLELSYFADPLLQVIRAPQFDQYAERGRVPDAALLRDGWWLDGCSRCGKGGHITGSDIEDGEAFVVGDEVLCPTCARAAGVVVDQEAAHA